LAATRAAVEAGIVAGGGTALAQSHRVLADLDLSGDEAIGREVVRRALAEPLRWIAINAGFDGDEVVETVAGLPLGHGFNALTGAYGDMFDDGVIDPFKVTRAAFESAASIAALLITTETAIVEEIMGNPGAIIAPGFGDLAEGMVRPSNIY
jgi:chaperonin GroEL